MRAPLLIVSASLLFALMGVCVKLASSQYNAGEIVFYRSLVGLVLMAAALRWRGIEWRSPVPGMHFWRSASGTTALCLWFYAIAGLPLATAMTLNYMSSVWMALFMMGGAVMLGHSRSGLDARLVVTVLVGFVGVALTLRPTIALDQTWHGLIGLLSGLLAAMAYIQVSALGRVGEPVERVVLYFAISGVIAGAVLAALMGGPYLHQQSHTLRGGALLLAIGVLATAAQWMMTRAYATGATLGIASLQYLGIVFSFGFGVWLFNDPVSSLALLGMALIIGAGVAATLLLGRSAPTSAAPTAS